MHYHVPSLLIITLALAACGAREQHAAATVPQEAAPFDADTAYAYVARQTAFGPRVPGTDAHAACADWIAAVATAAGADTVIVQEGVQRGQRVRNILARFSAPGGRADEPRQPVLLLAHYDTRPHADEDADPAVQHLPIDGANDGASGVAVLLELARQLGDRRAAVDVDLLFVDAEDGGTNGDNDSWCLGSQYYAEHLPYRGAAQMPRYAILADMVGGTGARFHREYFSEQGAPALLNRVWGLAARLGMADTFVSEPGGAVVDDHLPLLRAGIPAIDIVESRHAATETFPPTWHTQGDRLEAIDREPLGKVGTLLSTLIYSEKPLQ